MPTPYEKEMESLHTLLADVEADEDSTFKNEDNGSEDVLELNSSEHDTKSEEDGDSGNEEMMYLEWFSSKDGVQWRNTKLVPVVIILRRAYLNQKNQRKM
ncbi:hypothetical protein AVEN_107983-1 [Araneus ventricosus]|uniref:Uncharacterized protein n=1 Tax=Araneus ventricosus TaxID=182803 RepID=A0A4Y2DUK8_ARAVE|nr:hypothetical protein AVEN_107983-1 [Araneus ventricosus]